jgi:hypothetical protein
LSENLPSPGLRARANSKTQLVALAALLVIYVAIALAHAYLAPLTTGPDELAHYEYLNFIARYGRLPLDRTERAQASYKSDQPPLYHLLAALPASLVDTSGPPYLKRVSDHPRRPLIERNRHAWGLYNTEDELWPYRGEVLRWHVGRWVAIFFGAATVAVTFLAAREVFNQIRFRHSWLAALGAAAVVAFIPRFSLTGSMLNYETSLAFFAGLFLWTLLRFTIYDLRFTIYASLLGLFAGLAITTKLSALILPLEIVIGLWLIGDSYRWPWPRRLQAMGIAAVTTLLTVSWWFGFVLYRFNTVAEDGWWTGLLRPLVAADASDATTNRLLSFLTGGQAGFTGAINNLDSGPPWAWLAIFFRTFWTVGIEEQQPLGLLGLLVALGLCLAAVWGLSREAGEQGSRGAGEQGSEGAREQGVEKRWLRTTDYAPGRPFLFLWLLSLHLFLPFILPLIRYVTTFSLADTAQGRHVLFLAGPAFAILLVWGLQNAAYQLSTRYQLHTTHYASRFTLHVLRFMPYLPALFLLFWSGSQLWTMSWAYLPPLPVRTQPLPPAEAQVVAAVDDRALNDAVTLLGYRSQLDLDQGLLRVELWWQATAVSPVDYLTEISLVDAGGAVRSQWLGYAANGRYPTRAWDVGDMVRDTAWLPLAGLETGQYTLSLSLISTASDIDLGASSPFQHAEDSIDLEEIDLAGSTAPTLNQPLSFSPVAEAAGHDWVIWQKGHPITQLQTFHYRETILISQPGPAGLEQALTVTGPPAATGSTGPIFKPVRLSENLAIFIVGPDWPSGDYRLSGADAVSNQAQQPPQFRVVDHWERQFSQPPMAERVEANFANQVKLLGYDLPSRRVEPGGGLPVTLYWQGLAWMGDDYTIFARLLAADQSVHGGRDRLPQEGYRTLYWAPGEIVTDPFGVPVAPDAPDGVYYLNLGLYKRVNQQAHSLPLVQDGQVIDTTSVTIGPIKVGSAPPGVTLAEAAPQTPLNQPFGDAPHLMLLGYDLTDQAGRPIQHRDGQFASLNLTLYWRPEAILPMDYTTFVHVRDSKGEVVAQKDQLPLDGAYPTSLWVPGEIIADQISVPLPANLVGTYELVVGLYDLKSGARLTVPDHPENSLMLTTLEFGP